MRHYLDQRFDLNNPCVASALDEVPLWSAPFGMMLMERVRMKPKMTVLDVGCGTGFPILELAQRLGDSCRLFGIDRWQRGVERLAAKAGVYGLENVAPIMGRAEEMPFKAGFFDLIVSNNGLNNVQNQERALTECSRTLRRGGQLVLTYNLPGTMDEFYEVFAMTSMEFGKKEWVARIQEHILDKRKPLGWMKKTLFRTGFRVQNIRRRVFRIRYLDGSALLHSFFIVQDFLDPWKKIVGRKELHKFFRLLERNLNRVAGEKGEFALTIPIACLDCAKL